MRFQIYYSECFFKEGLKVIDFKYGPYFAYASPINCCVLPNLQ